MEKLNKEERQIFNEACNALIDVYLERIKDIQKFKWLCIENLPQSGPKYVENINVFEIEDKTIEDIKAQIKEVQIFRLNILE